MNRKTFLQLLENRCLLLDGSYGVQFLIRGYRDSPGEIYNVLRPEIVAELQREYVACGVDLLSTNTFSANPRKLKTLGFENDFERFNRFGARIAKKAAGNSTLVFGNLSSTGEFVFPIGSFAFDEAVESYRRQSVLLCEEGVDGFLLETFSDIKELKAAIMAVREVTADLPLIVNMTFEADGRSITGTSVENYAVSIQDLDVDVIGMNCTLTPVQSVPVFERLARVCQKPLCIQPNAGNPVYDGYHLSYDLSPESFAFFAEDFIELGASIIGGCCGTGPEHIRLMRHALDHSRGRLTADKERTPYLSSRTVLTPIRPFLSIGERINPASKKSFQEQITQKNWSHLLSEARSQAEEGAGALDLNLGIEKTLDDTVFSQVVCELDKRSSIPVSFDIQTGKFLETALREYPGRPLINSAKVTSKSLESKITLLKKYGGMVILLAMGKEIPETVEERVGIALEGIRILEENGISKERILVDPLVLSMASGKDPTVSLNIIAALSQKGVATSIGLSNLSYGLPNRSGMNGAFLAQAIEKGLTAAILNPGDEVIKKILPGALSLAGVEEHGNQGPEIADPILAAMLSGNREALKTLVDELLREHPPLTVSQQYLGKSMEGLGQLYARNEIYLPQLLLASDTVREIFDFVNQRLDPLRIYKGKVLLATVEGDVHDIGKNIVGTVLKSGGFEIIDLGKDVSAVQIVAKAKEVKPDVVGLSAMMTTTIGEIETVIRALHESGIDKPVIAGGASLNKELAHRFGCSGYAKDAVEGLELCKSLINR